MTVTASEPVSGITAGEHIIEALDAKIAAAEKALAKGDTSTALALAFVGVVCALEALPHMLVELVGIGQDIQSLQPEPESERDSEYCL